jgi:hypothetical protein
MIPSLLHDYRKYESIDKNPDQKSIDLSGLSFISPGSLLPIYHFARSNSISRFIAQERTKEHLSKIFGISKGNSNLMPLITINLKDTNEKRKVEILSNVDKKIRNMLFPNNEMEYKEYGDEGFRYIIEEILTNIEQHSEASKVYTYCQTYPLEGYVDVGILDNGVSIPGKYDQSYDEFIDESINPYEFKTDCHAIYHAFNGVSTKPEFKKEVIGLQSMDDISKVDSLGHGYNTSVRAITEVLGGSMLIASRNGICHLTPQQKKFIKAKDNNTIIGTLVCIRFKKAKLNFEKYRDCIRDYRMINDVSL